MNRFHIKTKKYILILVGACLLTGCSGSDGNSRQDAEKTEQSDRQKDKEKTEIGQSAKTHFAIDAAHPFSKLSESTLDLSEYGLDYEFSTDAQPEYMWTSIARAKEGYYMWDNDEPLRLMYYDVSSRSYIPLCNKPNCSHNNKDCCAFFSQLTEDDIKYQSSYIQYYDGKVYVMGYDKGGYVYLYQVAADGSGSKKYMTLYKADLSSAKGEEFFRAPYVCIHRGYVYFINNLESTMKIRRMKLGTKEAEVVFENKDTRPNLYRMKAYGDYLFFQSGNFIDDDYVDIEAGVFALNVNTAEVQLLKKGAVSDYAVSDDCLYYSTTSGIHCYSLCDGTDREVVDSGVSREDVVVHGENIFCFDDDSGTLSQYDTNGKLLGQLKDSDLYQCSMGDSEYFFAFGVAGVKVLSVDKLSQGIDAWTVLEY